MLNTTGTSTSNFFKLLLRMGTSVSMNVHADSESNSRPTPAEQFVSHLRPATPALDALGRTIPEIAQDISFYEKKDQSLSSFLLVSIITHNIVPLLILAIFKSTQFRNKHEQIKSWETLGNKIFLRF